jgi:hypothetical protein
LSENLIECKQFFITLKNKKTGGSRQVDNVLSGQRPIFEVKEVFMKKPTCAFKRGLIGSARQEEVRITYEVDENNKVLGYTLMYGFVRQGEDDLNETDSNKLYSLLTDHGWSVAVSMTIRSNLKFSEVITKGIAFKRAYFLVYDGESTIVATEDDDFTTLVAKEYKRLKKQYEKDYVGVTDLESLKDVLLKSDLDGKGFGFEAIN